MADGTYGPKVYRQQGGDVMVVASGGKIQHEGQVAVTQATNINTAVTANRLAGAVVVELARILADQFAQPQLPQLEKRGGWRLGDPLGKSGHRVQRRGDCFLRARLGKDRLNRGAHDRHVAGREVHGRQARHADAGQ